MQQGFKVSGTTRSEEKALWLKAQDIEAFSPDEWRGLDFEKYSHILSSIPPQETGDIVLPLIANPHPLIPWLGYLSTTGVYGDYGGDWVDETSELRPNNTRLQRRVAAEKEWLARGGHVFRLAGIYGPTRNALVDIKNNEARRIDKPGQVFSRIHAHDIAQVVLASMLQPNPASVYNVCDDLPAPAHEVVTYGCELLGVTPPPMIPFEQAEMSVMGREFYSANRRVKNDKIKTELNVKLQFPTYHEGLAQCLQSLGVE